MFAFCSSWLLFLFCFGGFVGGFSDCGSRAAAGGAGINECAVCFTGINER